MNEHLTRGEEFLRGHSLDLTPQGMRSHRQKIDWPFVGLIVVAVVVVVVVLTQVFLLPLTVVHADEKPLSDHDQEVRYCKAWKAGAEVLGGSESAITEHCARYI